MIEKMLLYGIGTIFLNIFCLCCWHNLLNKKVNYKSIKIWLAILLMTIVAVILNFFCPQPFKIIFSFIFLTIISYFIVERNVSISIVLVVISQIVVMISEFLLVAIITIFFNCDMETFSKTAISGLIINMFIALLATIIIFTKISRKFYSYMIKFMKLMRKKDIMTYSIMIVSIIVISTAESYMDWPTTIILANNIVMTLIFIFIVVKIAYVEDRCNRMNSKYQISINSLEEYGAMVDKYRILTHENKNQLLTIQKMTKDENVINYIDTLIDEKVKDNEKVMNKTFKIPAGWIKDLIYAKLCKMEELKIKYKLSVSNDVKTIDLINIDDYIIRDVCTVLGVYLDNAIEAIKNLKKKSIMIEFYIIDSFFCIDITNSFQGIIDINSIMKPKYTTKGEGHGYGLALVNKIISESENIYNECEVKENKITQRVKIKL